MRVEELLSKEDTWRVVQAMIKLYPQNKPELNYRNLFELVAAVLLSAQATDRSVNKVTPELFKRYPTPEKLAKANEEDVMKIIQTLGLYRNKTKSLIGMATKLVEDFDGKVPNTRKELESLPGVGRKTANVVLSAGFDIPAFAVDTHVSRVTKKFHMVPEDANVRQIEDIMVEKLPEDQLFQAHHSILLFGRYQCVARNHDHSECIRLIEDNMPEK